MAEQKAKDYRQTHFGEMIRHNRWDVLGISQDVLAEQVTRYGHRIQHSRIAALENGDFKRRPQETLIVGLARALRIPSDDLRDAADRDLGVRREKVQASPLTAVTRYIEEDSREDPEKIAEMARVMRGVYEAMRRPD